MITTVHNSPVPYIANIGELSVVTIINASCTTSFALNSRVTEPNPTEFLHNAQRPLLINLLQSTLRCSNSFQNASVDDHQIATESRQKMYKLLLKLQSYWTDVHEIFTQHNESSPCDRFKAA